MRYLSAASLERRFRGKKPVRMYDVMLTISSERYAIRRFVDEAMKNMPSAELKRMVVYSPWCRDATSRLLSDIHNTKMVAESATILKNRLKLSSAIMRWNNRPGATL